LAGHPRLPLALDGYVDETMLHEFSNAASDLRKFDEPKREAIWRWLRAMLPLL
jgi:hypothetical protein